MHEHLTIPHFAQEVRSTLRRRRIRGVYFDLDDTLIVTGPVFEEYILAYSQDLARLGGADEGYIFKFFMDSLHGLRGVFRVHPALLMESARITALHVGAPFYSPEIQQSTSELMEIYQGKKARIREGTRWTLEILERAETDRILITHASEDNTYKKLHATRISPSSFTHIFCLDDLGMKGAEEWRESLSKGKHHPEEILAGGDSWQADIAPALEIGVPRQQVFRIKHERLDVRQSAIEGVAQLDHVGQLPEHIIATL